MNGNLNVKHIGRRCRLAVFAACLLASGFGNASAEMPELSDVERAALRAAMNNVGPAVDRYEALTWMVTTSPRLARWVPDPEYRIEMLKIIYTESRRADLSPELVLAVMQIESAFDRFAISVAGARGLMQIMPFWVKEIGHPRDNLFQLRTNIRYGCTILRHYLDLAGQDLASALAYYNGSYGRTEYSDLVLNALNRHWTLH
jgi:soluble lytic murein transglycosylase-like protein